MISRKSAFTLIELLVVISIIVVLIGLTSAGVFAAIKRAKVQKAQTEVMSLLSAVKMFRSETGIYPPDINKSSIGEGLTKADVYGSGDPTTDVFGPYYEFKNSNSMVDPSDATDRVPMDPWEQAYVFLLPLGTAVAPFHPDAQTAANNGFVVVYSMGPDTANTADDIGTWQ